MKPVLLALALAGAVCLGALPAWAYDPVSETVELTIAGTTYSVKSEPDSTWLPGSEAAISLDRRFDVGAGGEGGFIQVRLFELSGQKPPNPCTLLQGFARTLPQDIRVSAGRTPQANMIPVCSMVAEGATGTRFYYSSVVTSGAIMVAGIMSHARDLNDAELNDFSRYLASIAPTRKE